MNTRDIKLDERIFALFKGDPGSGKSIAAASFPGRKDDPKIGPYFFDLDGRMKSVVNFWRPRGIEFDYDYFDSPVAVEQKLEQFDCDCPYQTLVYDGITSGGQFMLKLAKELRGYDSDGTFKKPTRRMVAGTELAQIEDYGAEDEWFFKTINNLKYLSFKHNINVIVTAHVLTTESVDLKTRMTNTSRTLLTGGKKVAARIPKDFDEAYHFDVQPDFSADGPKYTVVTKNTGFDWAKTALPIPTRIDFTNCSLYEQLMAAYRRGLTTQEAML